MSRQRRSSPRKLKMANIESDGSLRPKTSSATLTTLSPRTRESITSKHALVNSGNGPTGSVNAKKRLAVQPQTLLVRPQTSPEVGTVKSQLVANRAQNRPRTLKHKTGNTTEINTMKTLLEKPEERPPVVQDACEESNTTVDILVVSESRSGCHSVLSEVALPGACVEQENEDTDRTSNADKPLKDSSPPSLNNRYGNGIKTRLAKLFNKGNTCMQEPKVIEPQQIHEDRNQVPTLVPNLNGVHYPNR